jgi:hypothetical protein
MAIDHIEQLRQHFPSHFDDLDPRLMSMDDYLVIPTDEPESGQMGSGDGVKSWGRAVEDALVESDPSGAELEELPPEWRDPGTFGGFPGGLSDAHPNASPGGSTVLERLAFYLPFHGFHKLWGIYLFPDGIQRLRRELLPFFAHYRISPREQVAIAKRILYHHEFYHHAVESFATRLEAMLNRPCYLRGITPLYRRTFGTPDCLEETCANSYAREKTVGLGISSSSVGKPAFRSAIDQWFSLMPPGYCEAANTGSAWDQSLRPEFYECGLDVCLPLMAMNARSLPKAARESAWLAAGHLDRGIGDIRSRITYLVRTGSRLAHALPVDLRECLKGSAFKRKLVELQIGKFLRHGSGHDIWQPWNGGRPVAIPRHDGVDLPKGTLRAILKQLGASMSVEQFLARVGV